MSDTNRNAIIAMLAIVVTLYALKESHAHYLPDLFGLALALAAPRQSMAIGCVILLAIVRHSWLASGLAQSIPSWLHPILLPAAHHMSIAAAEAERLEAAYNAAISESKPAPENSEISQPVAEKSSEKIDLEKADLLARLILSGAIGKTEAIKIGAGAVSGKKYQKWSRLVGLAIERQQNHYPPGSTHKRYE